MASKQINAQPARQPVRPEGAAFGDSVRAVRGRRPVTRISLGCLNRLRKVMALITFQHQGEL